MSPAERVIQKFGGRQKVAEALGIDISRVYRWTYPRERGGTDGRIPLRQVAKLHKVAAERGIKLKLSMDDVLGDVA